MAFSTRPFFFFFFFFFLLSALVLPSLQVHARESHFFSKLPRGSPNDQNPSFATVDPKKEQENQDPTFVPQSGNGYGLYGHETSYNNNNDNNNVKYEENTKYEPYTTPSLSQTEEYEKYPKNSENNYYSYGDENKKNDQKYYNRDENNKMGENQNEKYNNYNSNAAYEDENEPQRFTNNNNNNNNFERQGMSDTRFMENGNYFYDVNDETNHGHYYAKNQYNPNRYGQNNEGRFYGNSNNDNSFKKAPYESRWEKNTMMNNNEQQEFGEEQEDQFVP